MSTCPSRETLGQLGIEITDGARFDEIERHIELCADCQASLEMLAHGELGREGCAIPMTGARTDLTKIPGFVIEDEIGRGSMGVVYRAWQSRLARRIALKVISQGPVSGAKARDLWTREALSVARVRDARVVQIHDVGETESCLYLVLEYVAGGSLEDRLDGPLPAAAAAALTEKIAGGVAAVHRAGLLHLDLKPSNILLDADPGVAWESISPKVADFGIARDVDHSEMTRTTLRGPWGTPSYMAPEQVDSNRIAVGPASDVYALGAILYELLTGRPPFRTASPAETMDQVRHQDPAPLRRLNPAIPLDLETICATCLMKDPKRRYPTVDALAEDLGRWRAGRPIAARPISNRERGWLWVRRHPLTATLGVLLAATLFLGFSSLLVLWRRAENERQRAERLHEVAQANFDVASQSLREICELAYQSNRDRRNAGMFLPEYYEGSLKQTRDRQLELLRRNVLERSAQEQLATVDLLLAEVYRAHGRRQDLARPLFDESIAIWEACIARGADQDVARRQQLHAFNALARLQYDVTSESEIARWNKISTLIYRRLAGRRDMTGELFDLSYGERQLADYMADRGLAKQATRFLQEKLCLVESLLDSHRDSPDLLLARALTLTALGNAENLPIARLFKHDGELTPETHEREMVVTAIAELTARTYGFRTLGLGSTEPEPSHTDYSAQAAKVLLFLTAKVTEVGLEPGASPVVAWRMNEMITGTGAHLRAVKNHEGARRLCRRFRALAEEFVRTYPGRAEPYRLLAEAHLQDAKNASRAADHGSVGRSLRHSLEAALNAEIADPGSEEVRRFVVNRRQRLARHESGKDQVSAR